MGAVQTILPHCSVSPTLENLIKTWTGCEPSPKAKQRSGPRELILPVLLHPIMRNPHKQLSHINSPSDPSPFSGCLESAAAAVFPFPDEEGVKGVARGNRTPLNVPLVSDGATLGPPER